MVWAIPILYIIAAIVLGRILPQIDQRLFNQQSYFSPTTATSLLSAIASGMIAFTGFVFTMLFVMVQFGSSAYSPRIARYFIFDPVIANALGIFIATFLYSLIALSQINFEATGRVPDYTVATAMVFMLASIIAFLLLIRRTASLQINNVLYMVGVRGEKIIAKLYPLLPIFVPHHADPDKPLPRVVDPSVPIEPVPITEKDLLPILDEIFYHGRPQRILELDIRKLAVLSEKYNITLQVELATGDMIGDHDKIITVRGEPAQQGQQRPLPKTSALLSTIKLGPQRTIEQDSRFAFRLIVDIGIHALSPAINDPTTAVQALDQLDDLLRRIAERNLNVGYIYDEQGVLRIIYPTPDWDDFLTLSMDEIRYYGARSHQVMRRMRSLLIDLLGFIPEERKPAVEYQLSRVDETITRTYPDPADQALARQPDRQGISIVK